MLISNHLFCFQSIASHVASHYFKLLTQGSNCFPYVILLISVAFCLALFWLRLYLFVPISHLLVLFRHRPSLHYRLPFTSCIVPFSRSLHCCILLCLKLWPLYKNYLPLVYIACPGFTHVSVIWCFGIFYFFNVFLIFFFYYGICFWNTENFNHSVWDQGPAARLLLVRFSASL